MDTDEHGYGNEIEQEETERTEIGRKRTQRTQKMGNSAGEKRVDVGQGGRVVSKRAGFSWLFPLNFL